MRINLSENKKFVLRAAAIFLKDHEILLHRAEHEDIWALPGGGCEFGEDSSKTLYRELIEELDAKIEVKNLLYTVENFFCWGHQQVHEVGLYHLCRFIDESEKFYGQSEFLGVEDKMEGLEKFKLHFKWFKLADLPSIHVKPDFLKKGVVLSTSSTHIINND